MKAGFIGTGNMGNPMARTCIAAGMELVVHDASQQACAEPDRAGRDVGRQRRRQVAEQCDVVFTSLPGPKQIDEVALADNGILRRRHARDDPRRPFEQLDQRREAAGADVRREARIGFLDAPVSGGTAGAEAGTLAVMVGGEQVTFEQVKPLLDIIGGNVFHLGENGTGTMLKLTNNILALGGTVLLQEVMTLGTKAGIRPQTMH